GSSSMVRQTTAPSAKSWLQPATYQQLRKNIGDLLRVTVPRDRGVPPANSGRCRRDAGGPKFHQLGRLTAASGCSEARISSSVGHQSGRSISVTLCWLI